MHALTVFVNQGGKLVNIFILRPNLLPWKCHTVRLHCKTKGETNKYLENKIYMVEKWKKRKCSKREKNQVIITAFTSLFCFLAANRWTNKQAESWWCFSIHCTACWCCEINQSRYQHNCYNTMDMILICILLSTRTLFCIPHLFVWHSILLCLHLFVAQIVLSWMCFFSVALILYVVVNQSYDTASMGPVKKQKVGECKRHCHILQPFYEARKAT